MQHAGVRAEPRSKGMAISLLKKFELNKVFTPGGQPSVTYVSREHLGIEERLKQAISQPSNIVSLTGPTKSGKTVLCRSVLEEFEYVWIDGGQIKTEADLWSKIANELRFFADCCCEKGAPSGQLEVKTPLYLPCPSWATG
jgi:hypothetical protein